MVQPPVREVVTSGSRPTEAGGGGSSSSKDPAPKKQRIEGTQHSWAKKQKADGARYPWANVPIGFVQETREEDDQPEVINLEAEELEVVSPWMTLKKAEDQWDWWSYPIDAGVYGQRQCMTTANTTMGACALYTLTIGKGKRSGASTAGVVL